MRSGSKNFSRERGGSSGRSRKSGGESPRSGERRPYSKPSGRFSKEKEGEESPERRKSYAGKPGGYRKSSTGYASDRRTGTDDRRPSQARTRYRKPDESQGGEREPGMGERRPSTSAGGRFKRPYEPRGGERGSGTGYRKPSASGSGRFKKPYESRDDERGAGTGYRKPSGYGDRRFKKPFESREGESGSGTGYRKPSGYGDRRFKKPFESREGEGGSGTGYRKPSGPGGARFKKPYESRDGERGSGTGYRKPSGYDRGSFRKSDESAGGERKWNRKEKHEFYGERKAPSGGYKKFTASRNKPADDLKSQVSHLKSDSDALIRLNKYIANAGICSRREADELISAGAVTVNGEIITTLGYKVKQGDVVLYGGEKLKNERPVYLLLNKPKDYITTTDDPQSRKTVMALIYDACKERVYPVGRLDRNTTGLLLFTNDGQLADKLTHPAFEVQKVYEVHLDKNLKSTDFEAIAKGVNLEDGFIRPDEISYSAAAKSVVGIELHSGRNRIVRRIFESFGYKVAKLDRVLYAGLTKKDLPRGKWRFLSPLEVSNLKMISGKKKFRPSAERSRAMHIADELSEE